MLAHASLHDLSYLQHMLARSRKGNFFSIMEMLLCSCFKSIHSAATQCIISPRIVFFFWIFLHFFKWKQGLNHHWWQWLTAHDSSGLLFTGFDFFIISIIWVSENIASTKCSLSTFGRGRTFWHIVPCRTTFHSTTWWLALWHAQPGMIFWFQHRVLTYMNLCWIQCIHFALMSMNEIMPWKFVILLLLC